MADQGKDAELAEAFTRLRKAADELLATLHRIADNEGSWIVYTPPEYALEVAYKRGRASAFARAAEIAEQALGGER